MLITDYRAHAFESPVPSTTRLPLCAVCGRHYLYFAHKDAEKPNRQIWFVSTSERSLQAHLDNGFTSSHEMRNRLLDTRDPKLRVPKLAARLGLGFSPALPLCTLDGSRERFGKPKWKTFDVRTGSGCTRPDAYLELIESWRQQEIWEGSEEEVRLILVDDIPAVDPRTGQPAIGADGKVRIMTDGDGLIALDLARRVPAAHAGRLRGRPSVDRSGLGTGGGDVGGGAPAWMQVRLWWRGYVAKGGLSLDSTLPSGVIVLRDSMIKVSARSDSHVRRAGNSAANGQDGGGRRPCGMEQAFELLRTCNPPGPGRLSPQLVPLLEHGGGELMVRLLLQIQREQMESILSLKSVDGAPDDAKLRRLLRELGLRPSVDGVAASPSDLLLAGFDPSSEPYLRMRISDMVKASLEDLACGKLRLEGSLNLPGRPDQTGTLPEGTICVLHDGSSFEDEVLIYRNPGERRPIPHSSRLPARRRLALSLRLTRSRLHSRSRHSPHPS